MFEKLKELKALWIQSTGRPDGSAFAKLHIIDSAEAEAHGRILAIDAAHRDKHKRADELEVEVSRVHADSASIDDRYAAILANL